MAKLTANNELGKLRLNHSRRERPFNLTCLSSLPLLSFFPPSYQLTSDGEHFRRNNVTSPEIPEFSYHRPKYTSCKETNYEPLEKNRII